MAPDNTAAFGLEDIFHFRYSWKHCQSRSLLANLATPRGRTFGYPALLPQRDSDFG